MGITDRKHKILQGREAQIRRNALAVDGGREGQHITRAGGNADLAAFATLDVYNDCSLDFCHNV